MSFLSYFEEGIKWLLGVGVPVAQAALPIMGVDPKVSAVVNIVPDLMKAAQTVFPDSSGQLKNDAVLAFIKVMTDGLAASGAKGSDYDKILPIVQTLITSSIATANAQKAAPGEPAK